MMTAAELHAILANTPGDAIIAIHITGSDADTLFVESIEEYAPGVEVPDVPEALRSGRTVLVLTPLRLL